MNCLIVEDEPFARELLKKFCERTPQLTFIAEAQNGMQALDLLKQHEIELIFLDIKMPELSGLELAKILNGKYRVIFTTAFSEYAIDGFELDASDYLLKPFDFPRFLRAIEKVAERKKPISDNEDFLFVKDGRQWRKLALGEIRYVKGAKDYVTFHLNDHKVMSLMTMKDLQQQLASKGFVRIHQSIIINKAFLNSFSNERVEIEGEFLPVSQSYRLAFKQAMNID